MAPISKKASQLVFWLKPCQSDSRLSEHFKTFMVATRLPIFGLDPRCPVSHAQKAAVFPEPPTKIKAPGDGQGSSKPCCGANAGDS
jgi:hypothetical protein